MQTTILDTNQSIPSMIKRVGEIDFPPRKVYLRTYGCQMNEHDSQRMLFHLQNLNFSSVEDPEQADLVFFNTCAIRDLSNFKFYSHLGETKHIREKNKNVKIGIGGCVAQNEGNELLTKFPHLNFSIGTDCIDQIGEVVYRVYAGENKVQLHSWDRTTNYSIETKIVHDSPQAFVNIIKGCDKFCSYCIVPFTRGREKSRSVEEVVTDVKKLVEYQGIQEVTLLGQNVNSFGKKNGESLAQLLYELEKIEGLHLIRYTTSHPYDVTDELVMAHGSLKKLSKHLHLPVQSGSNSILEKMLREYTVEHYLSLLEKLRKAKPDIVLSSDIICGFPNETLQEHEDTIKLLHLAQYDFIYSYVFAPRPGTKAAKIEDFLDKEEKSRRLREVQDIQLTIQAKRRLEMVGNVYRVLVEERSNRFGLNRWKGRTNCMRIVHFDEDLSLQTKDDIKWHWVDVRVDQATALASTGKLVKDFGRVHG